MSYSVEEVLDHLRTIERDYAKHRQVNKLVTPEDKERHRPCEFGSRVALARRIFYAFKDACLSCDVGIEHEFCYELSLEPLRIVMIERPE